MKRIGMEIAVLAAGAAFVAGTLVVGPSQATERAPKPVASVALADVLPFYGKDAPDWCAEDMACWQGSNADGRTDAQILAALPDALEEASRAYADTYPEWEDVNTAEMADGSFLVDVLMEGERQDWNGCLVHWDDTTVIVCPDGYVETS